ncbi:MAG TPA: tannase/feruloyl esterase family alpha/beta hydrolase [Bryobacteraceae bacterium]
MAATCESLASLTFPDTTFALVQSVAPGALSLPAGRGPNAADAYKDLPAFCRIAATLKPTSDSDIKIEVWLPANNWNGKFQAVGNGGWAGVISYRDMSEALRRGYATASTDTGHVGSRGQFALGHPEKLADFAWRSEHEMTVKAKAIVTAFYGKAPTYSYWNGCSTGGRQGLKEAQKFADDYDGIIAGAPANRTALALWIAFAELKDPASYIPKEKYPLVHTAVLQACDAHDGVKDGLIEDPTSCHFDPKVLLCKGADSSSCLTAAQVEAVRKIYSPATNPRTGQVLFPSLVPGSELGWGVLGAGPDPSQPILDQAQYVVYQDPNWNWKTFDFDKDVERFNQPEYLVMNATDPNLRSFFSHNGKLLLYHGWSDPNITPLTTVQYYKSVVDTMGGTSKVSNNVRLFLEPGMGHCGGGEGPNVFDKVSALEQWVENSKAPDVMIASHLTSGAVDRTRPLCPYPQIAQYTGKGSTDDAKNFVCREVGK